MIDISYGSSNESDLAAAAFGDQPGRWPLPSAAHRVSCGYVRSRPAVRAATAALAATLRRCCAPHRRVGWPRWRIAHRRRFCASWAGTSWLRGWDGRALALAGDDPEAAGDALTGLAADALGVGRLAAAATLLRRADPFVAEAPHRLAVRRAWVAAELAMAAGEGAVAVRNAEAAVELAADQASVRHRAKSEVVLAAALCSAGDVDRARAVGAGGVAAHRPIGPGTAALGGGVLTGRPRGYRRPDPADRGVARHPRRVCPPGAAPGRSLALAGTRRAGGHYCRSDVNRAGRYPGP